MFAKIQQETQLTNTSSSSVKMSSRKWLRVAAAILLPLIFCYGAYRYLWDNQAETTSETLIVFAEPGEKSHLTLPDGSRVWLNSGSVLTYHNNYNQKDRCLELNGEAYFEVTPNANKVFVVQCMDMKIEVLGTSFNIKAYDGDAVISTVLTEGKVKVTLPCQTLVMQPNERVVYNKTDKKYTSGIVKSSDFTDWRKNKLRFENETLQDIAVTIARIHNINYRFEEEGIKDLRFTGSVDNTNVKSVLDAIILTAPIDYYVKDGVIVFHQDNQKKKYFN
jgi:ferric-dicitrate binding protein FerR (iron transport regulator)